MFEPFLVRRSDAGVVEAWSERRLPFEPTGESLRFRTALREALSSVVATGNTGLRAEFASTSQDFVDTENVLFYNVGAASFARADRLDLLFERSVEIPAPPVGPMLPHFHGYEVVADPAWRHWSDAGVVVDFGPAPVPPLGSLTPMAAIWHAVRTGRVGALQPGRLGDPFGVVVEILAPREVHLASVMKPVIDGVVAAFHAHDGWDGSAIAERVANALLLDPNYVRSLLENPERAVLGRRRLLWRRAAGVQWNPEDDLLQAAHLHATRSKTDWAIAGRIVRLERAPSRP